MGWGASFATALASVGEAAKNAVNTAAATAQTAWNYTKQQSAKTLDSFGDWIGGSPPAGGEQSIQNLQPTDHALQPAQQCVAEAGQANSTAKAAETQVNAAFAKKDQFFTEQPAGSAVNSCPMAAGEQKFPPPAAAGTGSQPPPPPLPPCMIQPLSVKCGHSDRAFVLKPPSTVTNDTNDQIIRVIHDKDWAEKVTVSFACAGCPDGNGPERPYLDFAGVHSKATTTFRLVAPKVPSLGNGSDVLGTNVPFVEFARYFWRGAGYDDSFSYRGSIVCCRGQGSSQSFEVQVFPRREWNVTLFAHFDGKEVKPGQDYEAFERHGAEIGCKISAFYGQRKIEVSTPSFETAKFVVKKLMPMLSELATSDIVGLEWELPKVEVTGAAKSVEIEGRYDIDWEGELSLSLKPLVGVQGSVDLIQLIIAGAFPQIPSKLRQKIKDLREEAADGFGSDNFGGAIVATLDLNGKGSVNGDLTWYFFSEKDKTATGKLSADLEVWIEGKLSAELRFWKVSYEAGVSIEGRMGIAPTIEACFVGEEPGWEGYVEWKGTIVKTVAYVSGGGSSVGNSRNGGAPMTDQERNGGSFNNELRVKEEDENTFVISEPAKWLKSGSGNLKLADAIGGAGDGSR